MIIDLTRDEIGLTLTALKAVRRDVRNAFPEMALELEALISKIFDQIEP